MPRWRNKILRHLNWWFILYLVSALVIRFWNYRQALYFIFDVGRDVIVLREMSHGDLKLIGATTGLPGLFLGPLWYYLGLPGYILTQGNPYSIQLWYIALASLALPLYWILTHKLFKNKVWAGLAACLLAFTPGGINGTNFVWNVMLSVPLMSAATLFLIQARKHPKYVYWGFFFIALTLQSEFAYAVFFVTTLWCLIPWLRGRFEWKTQLLTLGVIGITLIPQGVFELTHHFSMTKALFSGFGETGTTVPQSYLWQHRPNQLWQATKPFYIRSAVGEKFIPMILGFFWFLALFTTIWKKDFSWRLIGLMALLPYGYYLFWRGNYGFFFDYYITPHFIFLGLLLTRGMEQLITGFKFKWLKGLGTAMIAVFISLLVWHSYIHLRAVILAPQNNAGLQVMDRAIEIMFTWNQEDKPTQPVFRIYTPNLHTENYDYLVWWYAREHKFEVPSTVLSEADTTRYVLYEPDEQIRSERFLPWYKQTTQGFIKTRQEKIGVLTIETWVKGQTEAL